MNETSLLSIREFSEFTGVSQSALRYYDEIGLLPAASRGENNYRFYAPFQIIKLNYINVLIDLGVPLSAIKDIDKVRAPKNAIELLSRQEIKLDYQLHELQVAYSIIHAYRKNIQDGLMAEDGAVKVEDLSEMRFVLGQENKFVKGDTFFSEFINFCKSADENRINLRYPIGGYYANIDTFLKSPEYPNRFFSLDPLGNNTQPAGRYLVAYKRGFYGEFGDATRRIAAYAKRHSLLLSGPVFIIYLLNEISTADPSEYLARIIATVSPLDESKPR